MLSPPLLFPRSPASSEPHTEPVTMECVDEPTTREWCTCGPTPKSQSWEESKPQECWPKSKEHSWRDKAKNFQQNWRLRWRNKLLTDTILNQVVTFQLPDCGMTELFYHKTLAKCLDYRFWWHLPILEIQNMEFLECDDGEIILIVEANHINLILMDRTLLVVEPQ